MNYAFRECAIEFEDEACITADSGFAIKPVPALLSPQRGLEQRFVVAVALGPHPGPLPQGEGEMSKLQTPHFSVGILNFNLPTASPAAPSIFQTLDTKSRGRR
jgi:hypothetical protein